MCPLSLTLPAEGINDQEVADHAGDADGEDDRADGVVGVVRNVHCGKRELGLGHHGHLEDRTQNNQMKWIYLGPFLSLQSS